MGHWWLPTSTGTGNAERPPAGGHTKCASRVAGRRTSRSEPARDARV